MKGAISTSELNKITESLDIIQIISEYVEIKQSGKNYKGLCPFHQEKTPSFVVNPEKQIFHCFGCGIGGTVISFLMGIENISFVEAVKLSAKKANLAVPLINYNEKQDLEKEKIFLANEFASRFYASILFSPEGRRAVEYLTARNLTEEDIQRFSLGMAPIRRGALLEKIGESGLKKEDFVKAGLLSGDGAFDVFRNRVIVPVYNATGRISGFGARALDDNYPPKYLNTSENYAFSKSRLLYGMHKAKGEIKQQGFVLLVEGYFDVIKLHINGIKNTVATMGTSLSVAHLKALKRYTDRIVLLFDSDEAGIKAGLRTLENILPEGFEVKICVLPVNSDPDSFIDEYGIKSFVESLNNSMEMLDFLINIQSRFYNVKSPSGKSAVIKEILRYISMLNDDIERAEYIKILAKKMDVEEEILQSYMKKPVFLKKRPQEVEKQLSNYRIAENSAETLLLKVLLSDTNYWEKLLNNPCGLTSTIEEVVSVAKRLHEEEGKISHPALINNVSNGLKEWLTHISCDCDKSVYSEEKREIIFNDCLRKLNKDAICERISLMRKQISQKEQEGVSYDADLVQLQSLLTELKRE